MNFGAIKGAPQRFWSKVKFTDTCWLWIGALDKGYGRFGAGGRYGKVVRAPRWAYEFCVGPIPRGLTIDHLCRIPACVNPDHLEPVTMRVNVLRGETIVALNARKTHCPQGHPYNAENTYRDRIHGKRTCRICAAYRDRIRKARLRTAKATL